MRDCSFVSAPEPPRAVIGAGAVATEDGRLLLLGGGVGMDPVANVSSLRIFQREAWLGNGECSPGEGVRVYADLDTYLAEHDTYSLNAVLMKDGTVLASERFSADKGETASVFLEVPEDLEPGTYEVVVRNVELDGRRTCFSYGEMHLTVTEAPSPTDRIGELEDQLAGKMEAWVGYAILIVVVLSMIIIAISSLGKRR
jgi:hypothetical protein